MIARDFMTSVVHTVTPRNSLKDAAQILFEHDCGIVPVVDGEHVKGVLSDRDVAIIACNHDRPLSDLQVSAALGDVVHTCKADDALTLLLDRMAAHQVRRLIVLDDDGRLEGVISVDDLASAVISGALGGTDYAHSLMRIAGVRQPA